MLQILAGLLVILLFPVGCAASAATLDEKIGRMLMVGFRGTQVDDDHFIIQDIRQRHLGGIILFDYDLATRQTGRNIQSPEQLKALIAALQQASPTPLLIAIDQEGGQVARLKPRDGFPATLSQGQLGKQDDVQATFQHSRILAEILSGLGIGLNLAPVVDLCANLDNPVIAQYERCFSPEPQKTSAHARRFVEAHRQAGVLSALKHFPGHGSSSTDSHLGFTDISESWSQAELIPFRQLIEDGLADAVMTAHVFNARLDAQHPATLSAAIITDLLRDQLGFDGVVISDDLQMGAITGHYAFEEAIRLAIAAGVDILIFGNNIEYDETVVERTVTVIRKLIHDGKLSEAHINASYGRIQALMDRLKR